MEQGSGLSFCHNFQTDVMDIFRSLREQSEGFDVILGSSSPDSSNIVCMQAHKMLIAAGSPLLGNILESNDKLEHPSSPFLYLGEVNEKDVNYILDYLYNGEVQVPSEDIRSFTSTAQQLQIKGIAKLYADVPVLQNPPYPRQLTSTPNIGLNTAIQNGFGMPQNFIPTPLRSEPNAPKKIKLEKTPKIKKELTPKIKKEPTKSKNTPAGGAKSTAEKPPIDEKYKQLAVDLFKEWRVKFSTSDGTKFDCHKCPEPKSFTAQSSLLRHYKQSHELVCKSCKMPFYDEEMMEAHYKATHEYPCPICGKIFTAPSSVLRHKNKDHPSN